MSVSVILILSYPSVLASRRFTKWNGIPKLLSLGNGPILHDLPSGLSGSLGRSPYRMRD
jgi:hypothetical protein